MFDTFDALWKGMVKDSLLTEAEYTNTNFPQVYRNEAQFTAPLKDPASLTYRAGLRLEHVEERYLLCPYAEAFAQHKDAERFAREYIPTLRSWAEPTFAAGLSAQRPEDERRRLLDTFFNRLRTPRGGEAGGARHGLHSRAPRLREGVSRRGLA